MARPLRRSQDIEGVLEMMAGRPIECMALIGLGFRSLSLSPASIGPIKAMIRSLDASRVAARIEELIASPPPDIRAALHQLAESDGIEL